MSLQLYNTMTRQKAPFQPVSEGRAGIYFCGPTVYSEPHLGHARGPIVFDVLRRWLEHQHYTVRLVSNITDVGHLTDDADEGEDKLVKRAKLEQLEPMEIAEKYFWAYFDAMGKLGVRRPSIVPRASGHITEQIEMTQALVERGLAYESNGNVYFDVSAWDDYGELSGRDPDDLEEGTRVEVRGDKDDPRDFALWKRAEGGHIMRWPSPWGEGYPGWHIECSVMSTKYLGDEFDIHGGGLDLIFPHHECEIAQAKGAGKAFARVWMHWNMMTLEGKKMAKSAGHFVTLRELFGEHDPLVVRFHLLGAHYRSVSDFSDESLRGSSQGLKRIQESYREVKKRLGDDETQSEQGDDPFAEYRERFTDALNDDLNTPQAIAALFDATRALNSELEKTPGTDYLRAAKAFYDDLASDVLGILGEAKAQSDTDLSTVDGLVSLVAEQRQEARARRDFSTADEIRDRLAELGIALEDTAEGSRWRFK
ncbi:MAG: cysteine--tRNA ligase [Trueperaceae bacterium]|nr:cysteine--tRNA ligase [Trueperaceae bacterium]